MKPWILVLLLLSVVILISHAATIAPAEDVEKSSKEPEKPGDDEESVKHEESEKPGDDEESEKPGDDEESEKPREDEESEKPGEDEKPEKPGDDKDEDVPEATMAPSPEAISSTGDEISEPTESVSEKNEEEISKSENITTEPEIELENGPEATHVARNRKGHICLLAKIRALFTIHYPTKQSEQTVYVDIPDNAAAKGKCGNVSHPASLHLNWNEFEFIISFSRFETENGKDDWALTEMEFKYDTSSPFFDQAIDVEKITARSKKLEMFRTTCGKSFECRLADTVPLYVEEKKVASVQMRDVHFQPFEVEKGIFSTARKCEVIEAMEIDHDVDETAPLAVGLTLTTITLVVVLGFLGRRSYLMKKVDYNNMEE